MRTKENVNVTVDKEVFDEMELNRSKLHVAKSLYVNEALKLFNRVLKDNNLNLNEVITNEQV